VKLGGQRSAATFGNAAPHTVQPCKTTDEEVRGSSLPARSRGSHREGSSSPQRIRSVDGTHRVDRGIPEGVGGGRHGSPPHPLHRGRELSLEPVRGAAARAEDIRAYWDGVTSQQRDARVSMGRPFVDGDRVAVEWWTTMVSEGAEVSLPGCLLLRFASDGRCSDLREYWNFAPGRREPFAGWGT
jgi:hypothetical protein